ncbi:MAG: hypothetical protein R3290_07295 [Acidimicrobiia bacterium]|nr:hypothetical protein [Acidimicrobiia bacterium]
MARRRRPAPEPDPIDPLAERFPGYLAAFGMGGAGAVGVGLVVFWLSSLSFVSSIAYTFVALGTLLLLVGGASGGGYTNIGLGAVEALVGGRNRSADDFEDDDVRRGDITKKRDPMARLRKGLRPEANPTAFWQIVAGFLYIAAGAAIVFNFG